MNRILIHTCCAPCFCFIHEDIINQRQVFTSKEEVELTSFWYNPNIQPKMEYERRKETLIQFCKIKGCNLEIRNEYNLNQFVKQSLDLTKYHSRCQYCYEIRLRGAFAYAKEYGYDTVMTTLTISPYQNQVMIKQVGDKLSQEFGVPYLHLDYTVGYREGQKMAKELGLYRQKYCGCVFSIDEGKWEY